MLQAHCGFNVPSGVNAIHRRDREKGDFVASITEFNLEEQSFLLNSDLVTRFIFVRNPYTRILSSYYNKIVGPKKYSNISEQIARFCGQENSSDLPTFEQFIYYVCSFDDSKLDIHFRSQSAVALFDQIEYNFIGKIEDFSADLKRLFIQLGASRQIFQMIPGWENYSEQDTSLQSPLLKTVLVNSELGNLFHKHYMQDFMNFQYEYL